jgi:uncharacterized protein (DUF924 family)
MIGTGALWIQEQAMSKAINPSVPPELSEWDPVLQFWYPDTEEEDAETHARRSTWRMRGGADAEIVSRFTDLTESAAEGKLDHWAEDPRGRLALLVILDQFSRSVWRDSPRAFSQDQRALEIALEGLENGHYAALSTPWERSTYQLVLTHCEGSDHLERLDRALQLALEIQDAAPEHLKTFYAFPVEQKILHRRVIEAFGRFPHRNAALGRTSTPEELSYVAEGQFPHRRTLPHG